MFFEFQTKTKQNKTYYQAVGSSSLEQEVEREDENRFADNVGLPWGVSQIVIRVW